MNERATDSSSARVRAETSPNAAPAGSEDSVGTPEAPATEQEENSPAAVPEGELRALVDGALLIEMSDAGGLRLTGADRLDFLHGQVSGEVKALPNRGIGESLLLNHKGHALAQMRVLRFEDELRLVVEGGGLATVEESLRRHVIFDQVVLERLPLATSTLQGPLAPEVLERAGCPLPAEGGRFTEWQLEGGRLHVAAAVRSVAGGFDLFGETDEMAAAREALVTAGAVQGSDAALDLARVTAGVASARGEAGEGVLPQEAGLEGLVSYRKGCYLGQEIMARIEARGSLRRGLFALRLSGLPEGGERGIQADGKVVGRLGTTAVHPRLGVVALAVLRKDLPDDIELSAGGREATRLPLPIGALEGE